MNKKDLLNKIIQKLELDLASLVDAAHDAHETATHEETVAKSKYETFALEASYLAQGQANRADDIKASVDQYSQLELKPYREDTPIHLSALVTLEKDDGEKLLVFLGPSAGGMKIELEGREVLVITFTSPLGEQLKGSVVGDEVEYRLKGLLKSFVIAEVA